MDSKLAMDKSEGIFVNVLSLDLLHCAPQSRLGDRCHRGLRD